MVLLGEVGGHATFQPLMAEEVDLESLPLKIPQEGEVGGQPQSSIEAAEAVAVVVAAAVAVNTEETF